MQGEPLVELWGVWKSYEGVQVLRGVDLEAREGEYVVVRGRSGVGKTTLLRIAGLLETPDRGEVRVLGTDAGRLGEAERARLRLRHLGLDLQPVVLIPTLTVLENLELPMALAGVPRGERRRRALELLEYFGLQHLAGRRPGSLSMGERRRVSIVRALANRPRVLLVDEPTANLDEENAELVLGLLGRINREEKVCILMATTELLGRVPGAREYVLEKGVLRPVRVEQADRSND